MDLYKHCVLSPAFIDDEVAVSIMVYTDGGARTNLFLHKEREQYLIVLGIPSVPKVWPTIMPHNEHDNWVAIMIVDKDKVSKEYIDYYAPELVYYINHRYFEKGFKIETALTLRLLKEYTDGTV